MSLTVTRGLAELTLLRKRINKLVENTTFISTKTSGKAWKDHVEETKAHWQAIADLNRRYTDIKFAILRSNANTKVTICGDEYTIAEAIALKDMNSMQENLLLTLKQQRMLVLNQLEQNDNDVRRKLDNILELNFKKDKKVDEHDIKTITEAYLKNNKVKTVDPLNLDKEIERLEKQLEEFKGEVDFVLSESNALTKLTLE